MSQLTRRSFLAGSAAFAASPAFGAPASHSDVVVIGAGAAGIAAARRIMAGGRKVTVLEAGGRVGGRCFTDTRTFGMPYDRGAHWIYQPDVNPLARLAPGTGMEIYPAPRGQTLRIGRRNGREGELESFLANLVRSTRAIADAARGKADVSCAKSLPADLGEWRPTIEYVLGPYTCAKDLAEVSAVDFARSSDRDLAAFCRQGYGALLARLASGLPVQLQTPVTQIDWSRNLEVVTERGRIGARAVIVTVSTAVLAQGKIKFSPALPKRQADAVNRLKLGSFDHIAVELAGSPLDLQSDELVFEKSADARTAAMLANIGRTPLCTVDVGGAFARELAAKGEQEMVAFAADWLERLYGSDVKRAIRRTHATRWDHDPWTLGAFSAASPGGHPSRRLLMEPLRDRIWFAGDAVHESLWGTVGGAWESGERAAEAVLKRIGAPAKAQQPERPARRTPRTRRR